MSRVQVAIIVIVSVISVCGVITDSYGAPSLIQFGQMIGQRYGQINDFSAKVVFDGWSATEGQGKYEGQVFFRRPNLFRIDYSPMVPASEVASATPDSASPEADQSVSSATMTTEYETILVFNTSGQYRWDEDEQTWVPITDGSDLIAGLLQHIASLATLSLDQFTTFYQVDGIQDWRIGSRHCYRVSISPKPITRGTRRFAYKKIDFDPRTLLPLQARLEIPNNRTIAVAFSQVSVNRRLPRSLFGMSD